MKLNKLTTKKNAMRKKFLKLLTRLSHLLKRKKTFNLKLTELTKVNQRAVSTEKEKLRYSSLCRKKTLAPPLLIKSHTRKYLNNATQI
jgi:hypothetical protein